MKNILQKLFTRDDLLVHINLDNLENFEKIIDAIMAVSKRDGELLDALNRRMERTVRKLERLDDQTPKA